MADLKNTTITNLTVNNDVTCNSTTTADGIAAFSTIPDVSFSYTTIGIIDFTNEVNYLAGVDKVGGRFTALHEGLYTIMFTNITNPSGGTITQTYINVNGIQRSQARGEGTPQYPMVVALHTEYLNVGDYIELEHVSGRIYLANSYSAFVSHRTF